MMRNADQRRNAPKFYEGMRGPTHGLRIPAALGATDMCRISTTQRVFELTIAASLAVSITIIVLALMVRS